MIPSILLVFAFVFAVIAAVFIESVNRASITVHFGWLALAFWIASELFGKAFR
jgi:hypothetical protein